MTVSRALRGSPAVRPALARRVRAAAAAMGYRPDPLLSALSARRRGGLPDDAYLVPLLTDWPGRDDWRRFEHYRLQFEGAVARGREIGYRVEPVWLREGGLSTGRWGEVLHSRGVRGVLVAPGPESPGRVDLDWSHFAAVKFGHSLAHPAVHYVGDHQFHSMALACAELRRRGFRRLGLYLRSGGDARTRHQWTAAFLYEQRHAAARDRLAPLLTERPEPPTFVRWVRRTRADVVLTEQVEAPDWLRRDGVRVPEEVGVAFLDLSSEDGSAAGICQHPEHLGAQAVDLLHLLLQRHEYGIPARPVGLVTVGTWVDGATLGTPRRRPAP